MTTINNNTARLHARFAAPGVGSSSGISRRCTYPLSRDVLANTIDGGQGLPLARLVSAAPNHSAAGSGRVGGSDHDLRETCATARNNRAALNSSASSLARLSPVTVDAEAGKADPLHLRGATCLTTQANAIQRHWDIRINWRDAASRAESRAVNCGSRISARPASNSFGAVPDLATVEAAQCKLVSRLSTAGASVPAFFGGRV